VIDGPSTRHDGGGEGGLVLTAAAIAETVGGTVIGDPTTVVAGIAPLDRASERELSFLATSKYASLFSASRAGVVLVAPDLANTPGAVAARVVVTKPQEALLALLPRFYRTPIRQSGIHPSVVIGRGVRMGEDVFLGPNVVIGDGAQLGDRVTIDAQCTVGAGVGIDDDSHLFPSVTLYSGAMLGKRVSIHSGARIGSDGFGYVFRNGRHEKIPHVGRCFIEDDVEIGANTTIDRGSIDDTVIGAGTKIDNLVQIGHNVRVGKLCIVVSQAGISGSARLEDGCVIGGQVGMAGHHTIGRGATIAGQSGVFGDVPPGEIWSGYPARPHRESLRAQAALFKLPALLRRIERLLDGKGSTQ